MEFGKLCEVFSHQWIYSLMVRTLTFLRYKGDLIMGKAGVPSAGVCEIPLKQARRLLYPLLRSLLRNMIYSIYRKENLVLLGTLFETKIS